MIARRLRMRVYIHVFPSIYELENNLFGSTYDADSVKKAINGSDVIVVCLGTGDNVTQY